MLGMSAFWTTIWGIVIGFGRGRTKTSGRYRCWLMKLCGPSRNDDESPRWRKMIQTYFTVLHFSERFKHWLAPKGWKVFMPMDAAVAFSIMTSHSVDTRDVRKVLKLVAENREWSCSYAQLDLFVDACGAVLVGFREGRYGTGHPLVPQARLLERLDLIAVRHDGSGWCLVDGDLVLLTNFILKLTGQDEYCQMTAECFLLLSFFFVMGDEALRADVEASGINIIEAVCFFGKVSMSYLEHLELFYQSYKNIAREDMPWLAEIVIGANAPV